MLLRKGLNIQEKQILVIHAPVEASAFVTELAGAAYDAGASQVVLNWRSDDLTRLRYIKKDCITFKPCRTGDVISAFTIIGRAPPF